MSSDLTTRFSTSDFAIAPAPASPMPFFTTEYSWRSGTQIHRLERTIDHQRSSDSLRSLIADTVHFYITIVLIQHKRTEIQNKECDIFQQPLSNGGGPSVSDGVLS